MLRGCERLQRLAVSVYDVIKLKEELEISEGLICGEVIHDPVILRVLNKMYKFHLFTDKSFNCPAVIKVNPGPGISCSSRIKTVPQRYSVRQNYVFNIRSHNVIPKDVCRGNHRDSYLTFLRR